MQPASDRGGGADPPNGAAADELDAVTTDTTSAGYAGWRQHFRGWRRSRPFWAGLWTLLAGLELAYIPLSDIGRFASSGQVAFTAVLPGIVLVIAGAFMWFSPPNRTMAGFLAMLFAVASLVLSNLGGLLIGMLLGIVGGAMAVGWTDTPRTPRPKRTGLDGTVPIVLVLVATLSTVPMVDDAHARSRCLLLDPSSPLTSGLEELVVDRAGETCLFTLPGDEASAPEPSGGAPVAAAAPTSTGGHDEGHTAPTVISALALDTLDVDTLRYQGIVTVPTATGTQRVLRFVIDEIDATGLDLVLRDGRAADFGIANRPGGSLDGVGVVLDCTSLSLTVSGAGGLDLPTGVPLVFSTTNPPTIIGPILNAAPDGTVLSTVDVDIALVTLSVQSLNLLGVSGGAS